MSRYTGPRVRKMRALGCHLPGLSAKSMERRPQPPGQHGAKHRKQSGYALRLQEKQKLQINYGLTERQFRRIVREASRGKGNAGDQILVLLERRLDNVVFRAGFAPSIPAARQLVNHGHFLVDGHRVDIPSYRTTAGQKIQLRQRSQKLASVDNSVARGLTFQTPWLTVDLKSKEITVAELPGPESVPFSINIQAVVEFYSQKG